jgi:hypothetical protein
VGAIYIRRRPRVRMEALISGGGQERGLRSGTLPTPLVVVGGVYKLNPVGPYLVIFISLRDTQDFDFL